MENTRVLEKLGLSEKEAKIYLDLLKFGESQTGKICERTNVPSSHIYLILENMLKLGLVNYKLINGTKIYNASPLSAIEDLFEDKEKQFENTKKEVRDFINIFPKETTNTNRLTDFQYFSGLRGIKTIYRIIANNWKPNDCLYVAAAPEESFKKLEGFFIQEIHKKRINDKVNLKIIITNNCNKFGEVREKMKYSLVKYLPIDTKTEYGVLNDYFFIINYDLQPYALLIKDKSFANTYQTIFNTLWGISKE